MTDPEMGSHALVALAIAVLCGGCIGPFSELQEQRHADVSAAKAADPSGRIPDILPTDATSIRDVHKIDVPRSWGCFSTRNTAGVRILLDRLHARQVRGPIGTRPTEALRDFSWWPESMSAGGLEAWEFAEPARCGSCPTTVVRVGIDAASGTVCFHRFLESELTTTGRTTH